jgi:hypothetical protein
MFSKAQERAYSKILQAKGGYCTLTISNLELILDGILLALDSAKYCSAEMRHRGDPRYLGSSWPRFSSRSFGMFP